jgi:hypothetical protein
LLKKVSSKRKKQFRHFWILQAGQLRLAPGPVTDVAKHALAITEQNLKASFEHARKLMEAKDVGEVMQLQTDFLRNQFGIATEQFKKMAGGAVAGANDDDDDKEKPDLI